MRKLKVLELFSGTRSVSKAFERRGHETFCVDFDESFEADWHADVGKITAEQIVKRFGHPDVLFASPECFAAGNLVWTTEGYKNIEDVRCDDYVLTHKGRMRRVTGFYKHNEYHLRKIKIAGCIEQVVTPNHPYYARKKIRNYSRTNGFPLGKYMMGEPEWVEAEALTGEYWVGIPINQESIIPEWRGIPYDRCNSSGLIEQKIVNTLGHLMDDEDFWWVVGRYFGDGYLCIEKRQVDICCGRNLYDERDIRFHLDKVGFKYTERNTRTAHHFNLCSKELCVFLGQFGVGAANKSITPTILNLPVTLLRQFLDGYISADGHWNFSNKNPVCVVTTISKGLAYGLQMCLLKAFGEYGSMTYRERDNDIIEGRVVNSSPAYTIGFRLSDSKRHFRIEDGMAWVSVRKNERVTGQTSVYTLSVDEDNSFTVGNICVHNCDSYSVAAISRHRRKDPVSDTLIAVSEYAKECDRVNVNLMRIIRDLRVPLIWIENPRGGMRKADWLQWCPRHTVTYCSYTQDLPPERRRMKPTDIFTNHPNPGFLPPCKNGDPCHARAPRGARTGTQGLKHEDRIRIPDALCDHIVLASEDYTARLDAANAWLVENGMEPLTIQWPDVDGQTQEERTQPRLF